MKIQQGEKNMTAQRITKTTSQSLLIILAAACCGAALTPAQAQGPQAVKAKTQYQVSNLPGLGGTSSGGNSINNQTWVAGYSRLAGDQTRHAALWRSRLLSELGTRGGPNSSVTWNAKNREGSIEGV